MKPICKATILASLLLGAFAPGVAHAAPPAPSDEFPHVFDAAPAKGRILAAIRSLERNCSYSEMERSGPSPAEEQRCERAETQLVALGPSSLGPVLATLDQGNVLGGARIHLYDAVGRFGDFAAVEPLVRALEKFSTSGAAVREWEMEYVELALQHLTFAKIGEVLPWEGGDGREPAMAAREWRAWLAKHPSLDSEALLAERVEQDRAHLHDAGFWHAFYYASFFAEHAASRNEGIAALGDLLARKDLEDDQQQSAHEKLREARRAARKDTAAKPRTKVPATQRPDGATPNV
jgi:hypothetical protein